MSSNLFQRFVDQLRREAGTAPDGGRYFRLLFVVSAIFLVGSLLAIGRIVWALSHGVVWVNFRGSPLSRSEMYTALALSAVVALCSIGLVASLIKAFRRL